MRFTQFVAASGLLLAMSPRVHAAYGPWEPANQKSQLLVLSAHPDDEGIFFGGAIPYYAKVRHMQVALVDMVTDYVKFMPQDQRGRKEELRNAAWHSGVRMAPVFGDFHDCSFVPGGVWSTDANYDAWDGDLTDGVADLNSNGIPDGRERAARFVAKEIRLFRPEVIVSHDIDGEYGHSAHKGTSQASIDGFDLAADASVDIDGLPAWSAKKLYLHLYGQHKLFHTHWETRYAELDGKTPREVADESLDMQLSQSQPDVSTFYRTGENHDGYDSERWGLYASRVGWDPAAPETPPADVPPGPGLPSDVSFGDFFANVPDPGERTYPHGDANFDGRVDFADLLTLAQHYGQPNDPLDVNVADFNLDGTTDFTDLLALAQHYRSDLSTRAASRAAFASDWALAGSLVPEPDLVADLAAAVTMVMGMWRRRGA